MAPLFLSHSRIRIRTGTRMRGGVGTVRAVAALTALTALATGCRNDTAPAWEYPELGTALRSLSHDLDEDCAETDPARCLEGLDRIGVLADRAFAEVLDHKLLDRGYVAAMNDLAGARRLRLAAAHEARARRDPHYLPLRRAVHAERLAYRRLLAELESLRTAPPPGDGTQPV
ncbi:hypothetical protein [Streptomyces sp. KS 21]|uniref:hypothetical protein n=1 Tax=Streptomyces sp. KS 21 TaxID=2485150 RepID=UPI0010635D2F|nr:hypothetical protein [Streptomyces sp. KS 21]TDU74599.1 hypothetical protein EDD91_1243 [Streptomyces sp. KS 21]